MLSILGHAKGFDDPWVGHRTLNRLGLHAFRTRLAATAVALRRRAARATRDDWTEALARDGFVVVPDLLAPEEHRAVRRDVRARLEAAERAHPPPPPPSGSGFGGKMPFEGGFDRYDGATLNRFLDIEDAAAPPYAAFLHEPRVRTLCRAAIGRPPAPGKLQIYLTRHGHGEADPQTSLHKDTFHASLKYWYAVEAVEPRQGPFAYVPGSHRMTSRRMAWERERAARAAGLAAGGTPEDRGGSFRIEESELAALDLPPPVSVPVAANTLVLADTLGFHRRGRAEPGTERVALYGWNRPWPFAPL